MGGTRLSLEHAVASHPRPAPVGDGLRSLYSSPPATQHPAGEDTYEGRATGHFHNLGLHGS